MTTITFNGVQYQVPAYQDTGYAQGNGNLSSYLIAVATGCLQQTGGTFTLTADANFGASFGLLSKYFTSVTANAASAGAIRLAVTDAIEWRNNANSANLSLAVNGSDQLTFGGTAVGIGTVNSGTQYQLAYYASSVAAVSGLTLITASRALASDANGLPVAATTTATELGYVNGVTSAIQTQLNAKAPTASPTFSGTITSGGSLAMGSNKITGLANGTASADAAAFGQIYYGFQAPVQATSTSQTSTALTAYQATNLQSSIVPTSASHRIKVTAYWGWQTAAVNGATGAICLFRGSTNVTGSGDMVIFQDSGSILSKGSWSFTYIDSPATTSSTTYTVKFRSISTDTVKVPSDNLEMGTIILEEIV